AHADLPREGEHFEGPSKTLTDAHFLFFSALTGDVHPIHYDVEYAKSTRFGKPLAHGLLLSALTALGASSGRERLHGFVFVEQGCRFLKPAVVGDTLTPRQEIEKIWDEDGKRVCRVKTRLANQRNQIIVERRHLYRVLQRATQGRDQRPTVLRFLVARLGRSTTPTCRRFASGLWCSSRVPPVPTRMAGSPHRVISRSRRGRSSGS